MNSEVFVAHLRTEALWFWLVRSVGALGVGSVLRLLLLLLRVRRALGVPYLLVFLSDELFRVVRPSRQRWDGEVGAALPGQLTAEVVQKFRKESVNASVDSKPACEASYRFKLHISFCVAHARVQRGAYLRLRSFTTMRVMLWMQ